MAYKFCINDFEGPLDLLLHLVKDSKMDLYEINITDIINQYLEFIHSMEELNIDIASEYLVMAAELIHLKSKLLINIEDEETFDDEYEICSEDDLKNKIKEYEKYKNASVNFKKLEEKRSEIFTKYPENLKEYMDEERNYDNNLSINDLFQAFLSFQEKQRLAKPVNTKITKREWNLQERCNNIREVLKTKRKVKFIDLFETFTKDYIIITFLSILEMTKNNEIKIHQSGNFSDIYIESSVKI